MRLRPKTARRLLLLLVLAVLVVAAGVGFFGVRKWQNHRRAEHMRVEGMALFQQHDYPGALDKLGGYLRRKKDDHEAWIAYAECNEHVEEINGAHLERVIGAYQRALALDPADRPTSVKLLGLYNEFGYSNEARDLAVKLRPASIEAATASDAEVLQEEAVARLSLGVMDATLDAVTRRLAELDPVNYRAATLRASFLVKAKREPEAGEFLRSAIAKNPGDIRFEFLDAITEVQNIPGADTKRLISVACRAAGLDESAIEQSAKRVATPTYTDREFTGQLLGVFDSARLYHASLAVLADAAQRIGDPTFRRLYARRAWQSGANRQLIESLAAAAPDAAGLHAEQLAFRALAQRDLGQPDDARATLRVIQSRTDDPFARVWGPALDAALGEHTPQEALKIIDAAIKDNQKEPVFSYIRGELLVRLGRSDEARAQWRAIYQSRLAVGWIVPAVRISETLLDEGRLEEAVRAAADAQQISPGMLLGAYTMLRAQTALLEAGRPVPNPPQVLERLHKAFNEIRKVSDRQVSQRMTAGLLPGLVALTASTGDSKGAESLVRERLAADPPPDQELTRRLAIVASHAKLGVADECMARLAGAGAAADAQSALARALLLHSAGKEDEALHALDAPKPMPSADVERGWRLARAKYSDVTHRDDALPLWKEVAAAYPDSLAAQLAVLQSDAASNDRDLIEQAVSRVVALGGSDADRPSVDVRLARARTMMRGPMSERTRDEAVSLLRGVIVDAPDLIAAREQLVAALLTDDAAAGVHANLPAAIDQLTAAAAIAYDRAPFILRLAELHLQMGSRADAIAELSKLALDPAASPSGRRRAVEVLVDQRELETARVALDSILSLAGDHPPADLLLLQADVLLSLRRDREALGVYQRLAGLPITDPYAAVTIASSLRALGDETAAARVIASLSDANVPPDPRRLMARARYAELLKDDKEAERLYRQATTDFPETPETWTRLGRFLIARSNPADAINVAKEGLRHAPDDQSLLVLLQQASVATHGDADTDIAALADVLARSPATARRAEALREIQKAKEGGRLDDRPTLVGIADRYKDDAPTQAFVARRLLGLTPPALDDAATITTRAMNAFPSNEDIVQLAVSVASARSDWSAMLTAAEAWRRLSRSPEADLAAAEAQLGLNLPRQAAERVRDIPLPTKISDDDHTSLGVLSVRARSAVLLDDADAALRILEAPIAQSAAARTKIALPIASTLVKDPNDVTKWIDAVTARTDPKSAADQLLIARAWAVASNRFKEQRNAFLDRALSISEPLLKGEPGPTPEVLEFRASVLDARGDLPAAIAAWRDVLGRTPDAPGPLMRIADASARLAASRRTAGDRAGADAAANDMRQAFDQLFQNKGLSAGMLNDMAIIAERADDLDIAIRCYQAALALTPPPTGDTQATIKNNLAFAIFTQSRRSGDSSMLEHARTLAIEATKAAEMPDLYETLGSIEAALGNRSAAIAAYRRALALSPKTLPASIGLAELLSQGQPPEPKEARDLLAKIDDILKSGAAISDLRKEQLAKARAQVNSH